MASLSLSLLSVVSPVKEENYVVYRSSNFEVVSSNRPIAPHALRVRQISEVPDYAEEYTLLQKIGHIWQKKQIATDYLIYHTNQNPQVIEIVPFHQTAYRIAGFWQQLKVFGRICFEWMRIAPSKEERTQELKEYASWSEEFKRPLVIESKERVKGDRLSQALTIDRQYVLKKERVQLLYDRYPIGFGGEKLHFLVIAKERLPQDFSQMNWVHLF